MRPLVYGIGVDPASRGDYCAAAVLHPGPGPVNAEDTVWHVDSLDRLRGIEVDEIADVTAELARQVSTSVGSSAVIGLTIDATGLGEGPAATLYRWASDEYEGGQIPGLAYRAVRITSGTDQGRVKGSAYLINVARSRIVLPMVMAARTERLDVSRLADEQREALAEEMRAFTRVQLPSGRERLEHADGHHDDLLFALGLAMWIATQAADMQVLATSAIRYQEARTSRSMLGLDSPAQQQRRRGELGTYLESHGLRNGATWARVIIAAYDNVQRGTREDVVKRAIEQRRVKPVGMSVEQMTEYAVAWLRNYRPAA